MAMPLMPPRIFTIFLRATKCITCSASSSFVIFYNSLLSITSIRVLSIHIIYLGRCKHPHRENCKITDFLKITLKIAVDQADSLHFMQ